METLPDGVRFQIGVDIAEVPRIAGSLKKFGRHFKERNFSEAEIIYCDGKRLPAMHYAGRWAAKEAFLKAVGIGIMRGIPMNTLSIVPPEGRTRPYLTAEGEALKVLKDRKVVSWDLNITHSRTMAVAAAVVFFSK
ncbi:holo-ACP synthase [bacterium]|nr:holo-ACP synthase [bacterium]